MRLTPHHCTAADIERHEQQLFLGLSVERDPGTGALPSPDEDIFDSATEIDLVASPRVAPEPETTATDGDANHGEAEPGSRGSSWKLEDE